MNFAEKYLDVMMCVLMADKRIDENEKKLFYSMLDNSDINEALRNKYEALLALPVITGCEEYLIKASQNITAEQLAAIVKDAYLMAAIDRNIDETEILVINRFLELSGIPQERFDQIKEWSIEGIDHLKRGMILVTKELSLI